MIDAFCDSRRIAGLLFELLGQVGQHQPVRRRWLAIRPLASASSGSEMSGSVTSVLDRQIDRLARLEIFRPHDMDIPLRLTTGCFQLMVDSVVLPLEVDFLAVHLVKRGSGRGVLDHIIKAVGHNRQLGSSISAMTDLELGLIMNQARRPNVDIGFIATVPVIDRAAKIETVPTGIRTIEIERRVIAAIVEARAAIPRCVPQTGVLVAVVVPIVEVPVPRTHEQVDQETRHVDREAGLIAGGTAISVIRQRPSKSHWAEQRSTPGEPVIPVAGHIHTTAWCPVVLVRNPHVLLLAGGVVPRGPAVVVGDVVPVSRHPQLIIAGGRDIRSHFQRLRWEWDVGQILRLGIVPETADPLETTSHLGPIPRHPPASRRRIAPHTAHPQVILGLRIPAPIA